MNSFMPGKKLDVTGIANELIGASAFFPGSPDPLPSPTSDHSEKPPEVSPIAEVALAEKQALEQKNDTPLEGTVPEKKKQKAAESKKASMQSREQASKLASYHASVLAKISKAVREIGKEVSYTRLTQEEKRRLLDVIYTFKSTGVKTTENELMRIALNFLLEDYDLHKEGSILHKILHQ
jgi:hypothetical protein